MMYKLLSIFLAVLLGVLGVFYVGNVKQSKETEDRLNNQIGQLQGVIKESETAYSVLAVKTADLATKNIELQININKRKEEIAALGLIVLEWKDKYYKIANAESTVIDDNGNKRIRVDFKQEQDGIEVSGFTLSSPAYAEVKLHWTKPLTLELVLTRDKNKNYRVYVDPNNPTVVPTEIKLSIDSSVFDSKWYERVSLTGQLAVGAGVLSSIGLSYDVLPNLSVGPNVVFMYDGIKFTSLYGASLVWHIFRN